MKPNASLKSLNVNCLVMASRPFTSLQPESLASAAVRALPVNFSAMVGHLTINPIVPRIGPHEPLAKTARTPTLSARAGWLFLVADRIPPGGPDVLVPQYRHR